MSKRPISEVESGEDGAHGVGGTATETLQDSGSTSGGEFVQGIHINLDAMIPPKINSVHNAVGSHVLPSIKEKIVAGQYVDFETLLESQMNVSNDNKITISNEGELILKPSTPSKQKITGIESWSDAFVIYCSIYLSAHPEKSQDLIKYMHTIRTGAKRHHGMGWKLYDQQFRLRLATDPSAGSFGQIDNELWLMYMASSSLPFDQLRGSNQNSRISKLKCYDYNFRQCVRDHCSYLHFCLNCNSSHPYRYCVRNRAVRGQARYTWRASGTQGQPRPNLRPRFFVQKPRFAK